MSKYLMSLAIIQHACNERKNLLVKSVGQAISGAAYLSKVLRVFVYRFE